MKFLTRFSLKNAVAVFILSFLVITAGLYSAKMLKMDLLPNIEFPQMVVQVVNPGATAFDMEEQVNGKVEKELQNIGALKKMNTTSFDNVSMYILEFAYGTDMEKKETEIKNALEKQNFPDKISTKVTRFSFGSIPIYNFSLFAKGNTNVEKVVEEELKTKLESIEGINEVQVMGLKKKVVNITVNKEKMMQKGINVMQIKEAIENSKIGFPVGTITEKDKEFPVRVEKESGSLQDIAITTQKGKVFLRDIATIKEGEEVKEMGRYNQKDAIGMNITKKQDANTVEVAEEVLKVLNQYKDKIDYSIGFDQADGIEESVTTLIKEGLFGALFASIAILVFLRSVRATIIAVISIPMSLLITSIFLHQLDITLNMMSLGGMAVAVGRVVDDSIVVIENIFRRMKRKHEGSDDDMIMDSTKEILGAITSSTITTAVVFLPLGFVGGIVGEMFLPFALTVVISLFASLFVAITIVPILAKFSFKNMKHEEKQGKLETWYASIIRKALNHKVIVLIVSIILLVGSFAIVPLLGFTFLPNDENKQVLATVELHASTSLEGANEQSKKAEDKLLQNKQIDGVTASVGGQDFSTGVSRSNVVSYFINLKDTADVTKEVKEIENAIQKEMPKGTKITVQELSSGGPPASNSINIDLYTKDLDKLEEAAKQTKTFLEKRSDVEQVTNNFEEKKNQYVVELLPKQLEKHGVDPQMVLGLVANEFQNVQVNRTAEKGKEEHISIQYDKKLESKTALENMMVFGAKGPIALKEVANVTEKEVFTSIQKLDGKLFARVSGEVKGKNIKVATDEILKDFDKEVKLPKGVEVMTGGGGDETMEAFATLGLAMVVAVGLVYVTMLVTFGKARIPFIILSSLVFVPIGALGGLWITGEPLSLSVMIGMLMLIGIVTTNAIVFVDRVGQNIEKKGMIIRDALIEAGKTRLRPILMTAFATITALLPLAFSTASGTLISKGLAIVVIGGLTTSTLLTLIVIPVIYEIFFFKKVRKELQK